MKQLNNIQHKFDTVKRNDITIDFWFYLFNADLNFELLIEMQLMIKLKINQLNTNIVDIKCRQYIDGNMTYLGKDFNALYLNLETSLTKWTYIRCSISNILLEINMMTNDKSTSKSVVFAKRNIDFNSLKINVADYKGYAYLRELRYFRRYFYEINDIRFTKNLSFLNTLGYIKFDSLKGKQTVNEEIMNVDVVLVNSKPGFNIEQLLPNDIPDIPLCDENMTYQNNTCVKSDYYFKTGSFKSKPNCYLYDLKGSCIYCLYGNYLLNGTCVSGCPNEYLSNLRMCYPCEFICDINNNLMSDECSKCSKKNFQNNLYSSIELLLNQTNNKFNNLNDENKSNFIIELLINVPSLYTSSNNIEYMLFSLEPFQLTLNNSLVCFKYINGDLNFSTEIARTTVDFNRWNHLVLQQSKNRENINIYLNSVKLFNLTNKNSSLLNINDLVRNYNYCLSYIKNLRIWGKNANLNLINFYQNYFLYLFL